MRLCSRLKRGVRAMKRSIRILGMTLLAVAAPSMAKSIVTFASGQASVPLPNSYHVTIEGDVLIATFGEERAHKLEITMLGALSSENGEGDLGATFVRDQGLKKSAKVSSAPGRAVLMEAGGDTQAEGKTFRIVHWQIGAGNCVFTLTVTAPLPLSSDLDEFLGGPLNEIINNVSCKKL